MLSEQNGLSKIQELKKAVEQKCGRRILASSDCILLAADVHIKTGIRLSFNTIRRCFDILKTNHQPSLYTLDTLSNYCGFTSFGDFISSDNTLIKKETDPQKAYLLDYMVLLFDRIKLKSVNDHTYHQLVLNTIEYLNRNNYLIDDFQKQIAKTANGHLFYYEYYINIDRLNSFYGDGLKYYLSEKKTIEAQVFGYSLLCFNSWLICDNKGVEESYVKVIHFSSELPVQSDLWSRNFATQLFFLELNKLDKEALLKSARHYYSYIKTTVSELGALFCFELIMAEALTLTEEFNEALFYIDNARNIYVDDEPGYITLHFNEVLNLIEAMALFGIGKSRKSRDLLNKVNPKNFFLLAKKYYTIQYLILKLTFCKGKRINKELEGLVEFTGFKRLKKLIPIQDRNSEDELNFYGQ